MNLTDLLKEKGYKPYRFCFSNKSYILDEQNYNDFSSAVSGKLCVFWVLNEDFKNRIIIGLNEAHKPPTLVSPRPNIEVIRKKKRICKGKEIDVEFIEDSIYDDSMNLVLQKENSEKIYEAIFDKTIIFKYDLR